MLLLGHQEVQQVQVLLVHQVILALQVLQEVLIQESHQVQQVVRGHRQARELLVHPEEMVVQR